MKKFLALILALTMMLVMLAGCQSNEPNVSTNPTETGKVDSTTAPEVEEKPFDGVELVFYANASDDERIDARVAAMNEILSEKLGVTIEVVALNADTYELEVSGNDKIDLVYQANWLNFTKNADQGLYAEITDEMLNEYCPDLMAYINETGRTGMIEAPKVNGVRYGVGSRSEMNEGCFAYRGDLAEKYGIGTIENADDMYKYLMAIAENEPDMTAYETGVNKYYLFAGMWYPDFGWSAVGSVSYGSAINGLYHQKDNKVALITETPEYLDYITKMNALYKAGVFPSDVTAWAGDDKSDFLLGKNGLYRCSNHSIAQSIYDAVVAEGHEDWNIKFYSSYATGKDRNLNKGYLGGMIGISAWSEDVDACLAVINEFFVNEELYKLAYYGIEGEDYKFEDGKYVAINTASWLNVIRNDKFSIDTNNYTYPGFEELNAAMLAAEYDHPMVSIGLSYDNVAAEKAGCDEVQSQITVLHVMGIFDCTPEEAVAKELAAYKAAGVDALLAEIQRQIDEQLN